MVYFFLRFSILAALSFAGLSATAEAQQETSFTERLYKESLDKGYRQLTRYTWGYSFVSPETPRRACAQFFIDKELPEETINSLTNRCKSELTSMLDELRQDLTANKTEPKNCLQWAIKEGDDWRLAGANMRHSPLGNSGEEPGRFEGQLIDSNDTTLLISNKEYDIDAVLRVGNNAFVISPSTISMNDFVRGYGIVTGSTEITLGNGNQQSVAVIEVACLQ